MLQEAKVQALKIFEEMRKRQIGFSELIMEYLTKYRAQKKSKLDFLNDSETLLEPFLELVNAYNR